MVKIQHRQHRWLATAPQSGEYPRSCLEEGTAIHHAGEDIGADQLGDTRLRLLALGHIQQQAIPDHGAVIESLGRAPGLEPALTFRDGLLSITQGDVQVPGCKADQGLGERQHKLLTRIFVQPGKHDLDVFQGTLTRKPRLGFEARSQVVKRQASPGRLAQPEHHSREPRHAAFNGAAQSLS